MHLEEVISVITTVISWRPKQTVGLIWGRTSLYLYSVSRLPMAGLWLPVATLLNGSRDLDHTS